jgi:rhodanese-related sulfurtransferase
VTINQKLASAAAVLAVLALVVGSRTQSSDVDLAALARDVEQERDHVDALELAEWIRAQKPNLRVLDVRSSAEFDEYHLPRAEHVPLGRITEFKPRPGEVVVLYSEGGTHAAQAWFFLRAMGVREVYFLRGGLNEWLDDVMSPRLPTDARTRELIEYFGGAPGSADPADSTLKQKVRRLKQRTC